MPRRRAQKRGYGEDPSDPRAYSPTTAPAAATTGDERLPPERRGATTVDSAATIERWRADIAAAKASGLLSGYLAKPQEAPGYYAITSAYRDLLSWPSSIVDELIDTGTCPEPFRSVLTPAHRIAVTRIGQCASRLDPNSLASTKEVTDRLEGKLTDRTVNTSQSVTYVVGIPEASGASWEPSPELQATVNASVTRTVDEP